MAFTRQLTSKLTVLKFSWCKHILFLMSRKLPFSDSPMLHQKALTQVLLPDCLCEILLSLLHFAERVRVHYPKTVGGNCSWRGAQHCIYSGKAFKRQTTKTWNFGKGPVVPSTCSGSFLSENMSGFVFEQALPCNSSTGYVFTRDDMSTKPLKLLCRYLVLHSEGNSKTFREVLREAWGIMVLCWYQVHEDWDLRYKRYRVQMGHISAVLRGVCRQSDWRHSERCWRSTDIWKQGCFLGEVTSKNCTLDENTRFKVICCFWIL